MTEKRRREELRDKPVVPRILHDFGYFGHYLHMNAGGRSGKRHILGHLHRSGGSMTQRELLDSTCISSAALSEVTAKLEAEGLITRTRSEADRRQLVLKLTDEGSSRAEQLLAEKRAFEEEAFACLSPAEQWELLGLLDRVADHWQGLAPAHGREE